jgi:hypothetical protein
MDHDTKFFTSGFFSSKEPANPPSGLVIALQQFQIWFRIQHEADILVWPLLVKGHVMSNFLRDPNAFFFKGTIIQKIVNGLRELTQAYTVQSML